MDSSLTPPQEQVLALISAGSTVSAAAQSAGVHRNTVHHWVRSAPLFRQALTQAREAKALYWKEQAELLAPAALETIGAVMQDAAVPAAVRLKAAQSILNLATVPPLAPPSASYFEHLPPFAADPAPESLLDVHNSAQPVLHASPKIGRNDVCPCGSGKKFKRCCLGHPAGNPPPESRAASATLP